MKILFKIISAFLYFNSVSPVLMYYIYDDNPNVGFVALDGFGITGSYNTKPAFNANSKKQFTGSYNPKYQKLNNEHVVDSHFKVMKSPLRYSMSTALENGRLRNHEATKNNAQRVVEDYRNTEAPKQWQQRPQQQQQKQQQQQVGNTANSGQKENQQTQVSNNQPARNEYIAQTQEATARTQPSNNQQIPPIRPKSMKADYNNLMKQRSQRNEEAFEPKPSFVQMNTRKTQMSADAQKVVRLNNNRQLTALTIHTSQDRQRMPGSMMMDKTLHKTNGLHDHNMQVMSRVLEDMTQKITDRRHKKGEYRKRDTKKILDVYEKSKRSVVSDNMRKYIGKDKSIVKEHRNNMELARIGSHEESLETNDAPYALFYRMNPESLDQQEGFMTMGSIEDNNSGDFTNSKEKGEPSGYEGEISLRSQKPMKTGNTLKLRKKLKNFSNFRNH